MTLSSLPQSAAEIGEEGDSESPCPIPTAHFDVNEVTMIASIELVMGSRAIETWPAFASRDKDLPRSSEDLGRLSVCCDWNASTADRVTELASIARLTQERAGATDWNWYLLAANVSPQPDTVHVRRLAYRSIDQELDSLPAPVDANEMRVGRGRRFAAIIQVSPAQLNSGLNIVRRVRSAALVVCQGQPPLREASVDAFGDDGLSAELVAVDWLSLATRLAPMGAVCVRVHGDFDDPETCMDFVGPGPSITILDRALRSGLQRPMDSP